jgi:hypothetical protein
LEAVECFDPSLADDGLFIDVSGDNGTIASISQTTFAGRKIVAKMQCNDARGDLNIAYICDDSEVVGESYVLNFLDRVETKDDRVTTVEVIKVRTSGQEKVAELPCFYKN